MKVKYVILLTLLSCGYENTHQKWMESVARKQGEKVMACIKEVCLGITSEYRCASLEIKCESQTRN